jgi:adenine-specific DNA glycosylase
LRFKSNLCTIRNLSLNLVSSLTHVDSLGLNETKKIHFSSTTLLSLTCLSLFHSHNESYSTQCLLTQTTCNQAIPTPSQRIRKSEMNLSTLSLSRAPKQQANQQLPQNSHNSKLWHFPNLHLTSQRFLAKVSENKHYNIWIITPLASQGFTWNITTTHIFSWVWTTYSMTCSQDSNKFVYCSYTSETTINNLPFQLNSSSTQLKFVEQE